MKAVLFIVISLFICNVLAKTTWDQLSEKYTFEQYKVEFGKRYSTQQEENMRRDIFQNRLGKILAHNSDNTKTWREGVNHLTDRTEKELKVSFFK